MTYLRGHWQLFVILGVVFALWQTPVVWPLKMLVVYLHELSHALATWATGGRVLELSLSPAQGGHVISLGGNRFVILTAGYLGSLVLGIALLIAALRSTADRLILGLFGAGMIAVTALFVRDLFAAAFCLGTGAALLAIARFAGHRVSDLVLRVIGLSSVLYVPYDIFDDTIARRTARSDAYMLAEEIGGSAALWGGIWLILSVLLLVWVLRRGLGAQSNL
ncbi:M50 family metallopeptidase [Sulfitobacter albidus]|uniref:M50 family metallopeptidase n=1 Tax=Sulfitobacter albidus TaxID=2829501 RepID=A0A975JFN9_9RHOB|nr:M50 family metallopeptidase [Sulfitobacter albidus]QUJ77457.1 M50 family metallopeptidase [Sulfitobacter albidus]